MEGLKRWLHEAGDADRVNQGGFVISALHAKEEGRDDAIEAAADLCRRNRMFLRPLYEIAAESSDRTVREKVLEAAFTESAAVVHAPLDAIRGLAKFDAARAAEAVEAGLSNHPKIEREMCRLLVQLESERAAENAHWRRDRRGAGVAFRCSWPSIAVGERVDCRGCNREMPPWNGSGEIDCLPDSGMAAVSDGGGGSGGCRGGRRLDFSPSGCAGFERFTGIAKRLRCEVCFRSLQRSFARRGDGLYSCLFSKRQIPTCFLMQSRRSSVARAHSDGGRSVCIRASRA